MEVKMEFLILFLGGIILLLGSVGALECGDISMFQCFVQLIIAIVLIVISIKLTLRMHSK